MSKTSIPNAPLPFDGLAEAIKGRRSVYGLISGLRLDRAAPGEAWSSLPYRPVFVGDTETGVLHGGVVTAMLDESCSMAVQLALDGTRAIATLDLRIDYQKPATPGLDIKAHSVCYRVTRSIAFVRSTAYQESEDDAVATATACFMVGANRTNMLTDRPMDFRASPTLEAPEDPASPFAKSPFARCLGIRVGDDGTLVMPFSPKIIGNSILPAIHGGMTGAFLETTAIVSVTRELGALALPKPIGLTINYLGSGRALDSYAKASIVKQGRRVVAFEAQAWQHDPSKRLLARHLSGQSSAILMDPHLAYPRSIGELAPHRGLIISHEHSETENTLGGRKTTVIPGWSVAKARRIGADAVKVLIWYRADAAPEVRAHQEAFVRAAAEECAKHDIVMLLEILVYPLPGEDPASLNPRRTQLVLDSIRPFCDPSFGIDICKLEPPRPVHNVPAPESREASEIQKAYDQMAKMVPNPWVMLSAGAGADDFENSLHYAYRAGASGYLAGRAIWSEAFDAFPNYDQLETLLKTRSREILDRLNVLTDRTAKRWFDHPRFNGVHPEPDVVEGEFPETYG